jgi:hypothetical protein
MVKLMEWIEKEYNHKIPIIPNLYRENPSILIPVDFKKYMLILSQEIEKIDVFCYKFIKNNLVDILKILSGMDIDRQRR